MFESTSFGLNEVLQMKKMATDKIKFRKIESMPRFDNLCFIKAYLNIQKPYEVLKSRQEIS